MLSSTQFVSKRDYSEIQNSSVYPNSLFIYLMKQYKCNTTRGDVLVNTHLIFYSSGDVLCIYLLAYVFMFVIVIINTFKS